jgi:hypothetical protein
MFVLLPSGKAYAAAFRLADLFVNLHHRPNRAIAKEKQCRQEE